MKKTWKYTPQDKDGRTVRDRGESDIEGAQVRRDIEEEGGRSRSLTGQEKRNQFNRRHHRRQTGVYEGFSDEIDSDSDSDE